MQELELFKAAKHLEGCSDRTIGYYDMVLKGMLKTVNKPVADITTDDLRLYLADYQGLRNAGNVTMDNMRRVLTSFFRWLTEEEKIAKNPTLRLHRIKAEKRVKHTLSEEDLEIVRTTCWNMRDAAIVNLLASSGIRVGELVRLNRGDMDFQNRECKVFGKGAKERIAYFDSRAKLSLMAYLESRTDDNPALFVGNYDPRFPNREINRLDQTYIGSIVRKIGRKIGIALHPHKFRRSLATKALERGMPIEQVQQVLGHSQIGTTMLYAMVKQESVKAAHNKFLSS